MKENTHKYRKISDWSNLRKRYLAFWRKELLDDKPIIQIQNPKAICPEAEPWMLEASSEKYLCPGKNYKYQMWGRSQWSWHADLFQYLVPGMFGPMSFLAFCGCKPVFEKQTVWYDPAISSLDETDRIHFDSDCENWRLFLENLKYYADKTAGEQQIGIPVDGCPMDWVATILGVEKFLMATLEEPDKLSEFAMRLAGEYLEAYDAFYPLLISKNDGVSNWLPIWTDRQLISVQDDIAINISPEMYRDLFLPALRKIAGHAPLSSLHWHDGARQHLEWIVETPEIKLVQLGHDPASPSFTEMLGDMRKIQQAGKYLFISCVKANEVKYFIENLDLRGLAMIIDARNDAESAQIEKDIATWTRTRRSFIPEK